MSRIVVKNLPMSGLSEDDLRKHFADIDNITDVKLKYNDSGTFRRFAFVGFKSQDSAEKAIEKLNSTFVKNSKIAIESCKSIRDAKSNKIAIQSNKPNKGLSDIDEDQNDNLVETKKKNKNKLKKNNPKDFEQIKDDPEFKEFLNLQRNVGENSQTKRIWSDDAKMDVENVAIPKATATEASSIGDETSKKDLTDEKPKKRHKRSRGKKKSTKTKPKELFVHTLKAKGFPETVRRKDLKDFFKPLDPTSIRLNKRDGICFVAFKDESDLKFALRKDLQFWKTSRIKLMRHDVKKSRIFKETTREKVKQKEEIIKRQETSLVDTEPVEESGRLFVRNLNYTCTQEDLEQVFSKYGELTEVHFPIDKNTSMPKGYAYVEFMFPKNAGQAYQELNGTIFQGRNFHLIPAKPKPEPKLLEPHYPVPGEPRATREPLTKFKREKLQDQKQSAPKASNWNILFLGQNALADVVSEAKGIDKSALLTKQTHKEPIAVRMALGDATAVDEMRKFLISNGIELDSFDNPGAPRSRTVILAKNLPAATSKHDLLCKFELHGKVSRVIMPPNGLSAIIEMEEPVEAKLAFRKLAYSKFKDSVLYLEWAPINVFREKSLAEQDQSEMKQLERVQTGAKILVKNVPFEATAGELRKIFAAYGELNFVRLPKKIDGQHRGFGFVDYLTREDALRAFRALCHSTHLYGRKLVLEWAKVDEAAAAAATTATATSASAKEVGERPDE